MDLPVILALVVSVIIIAYLAFTSMRGSKETAPIQAEINEDRAEVVQEPRRRGRLDRMARRRQTTREEEEPEEIEEIETEKGDESPLKKVGKKKEAKMQMKEEKRQQRQAEEERREQKRLKEEKQMEEQKEKEAEREEAERQMALEEEKIRQERAKKEEEEYQQWKQMISVESKGTILEENQQKEAKIEDFIKYIQQRKVVMLEDLAAEFEMKTMDAIEFIERLDKEGRLSGLVDDRGKFIHVTKEEMEKVAKFIIRKGRVSIEDIARESNKLINLKPQNSD